tara:strand:- start:1307 stop:2515 length:1209 start_codon:yes stop_codon:yes gene_type:complete
MIGEKIKIGFDGSAVKRGLGGIMGGFGKLSKGIGRATRQVGIGAARQLGASLTGAVMKLGMLVPNEIEKMANLRKELDMMGASSGVTAKEYLALREAMSQTTGKSVDDASEDIKDISERIGNAMQEIESPEAQAMMTMGLRRSDLRGLGPVEQIQEIANAFKRFKQGNTAEDAMSVINKFLGGQAGKNLVPFFMEYSDAMAEARIKTAGLERQLEGLKPALEGVFQIRVAMGRKLSEFSMGVLQGVNAAMTGATGSGVAGIAEWLESQDVAGFANKISGVLTTEINAIKSMGVMEWIMSKLAMVGKWISDTIAAGVSAGLDIAMENPKIKGVLDMLGGGKGGMLKGIFGFGGDDKKTADPLNQLKGAAIGKALGNAKLEDNTSKANDLLQSIADGVMVGRFA